MVNTISCTKPCPLYNTLLLTESAIIGSKTHLFNARITPIAFADIEQIELQRYVGIVAGAFIITLGLLCMTFNTPKL